MVKTYKFKLYRQKRTKHIDHQLWVACKVYNHAIALLEFYHKLNEDLGEEGSNDAK